MGWFDLDHQLSCHLDTTVLYQKICKLITYWSLEAVNLKKSLLEFELSQTETELSLVQVFYRGFQWVLPESFFGYYPGAWTLQEMHHCCTFALRDSRDSNMCSSSELSISSNIPVIFPAMSGYMLWISGNRRSPSICFCSCGGASANMLAVSGSWPCIWRAVGGAIYNRTPHVSILTNVVAAATVDLWGFGGMERGN